MYRAVEKIYVTIPSGSDHIIAEIAMPHQTKRLILMAKSKNEPAGFLQSLSAHLNTHGFATLVLPCFINENDLMISVDICCQQINRVVSC
jgi:hypothetical protein